MPIPRRTRCPWASSIGSTRIASEGRGTRGSMARHRGFSMLELMAVVAVIGILAVIAVPTYMDRIVREQVKSSLELADIAKPPIAASWKLAQTFPSGNAAIGLPVAEKVV